MNQKQVIQALRKFVPKGSSLSVVRQLMVYAHRPDAIDTIYRITVTGGEAHEGFSVSSYPEGTLEDAYHHALDALIKGVR